MNLKLTIILPLCCSLLTLFVGCNKYEYARPKPWGTSGKLNANKYDPESVSNPYGKYGSKYSKESINNPYGKLGSKYSNQSVNNPHATDAPKIYDSNNNYMGKLSSNKYDPESVSNPYGKYGSKYSPNSINNPYSSSNTQSSFGSGFKVQNNFNSYSSPMINNSINNNRINNNPINNNSFNSRPSFFGGGY